MKKYILKFGLLIIAFIIIMSNKMVIASFPLTGKVIVVDSGHGR